MHLTGRLERQIEELVRLTLLAYLTTSFELLGNGMEYMWLRDELEAVSMHGADMLREDTVLKTWVLMIASISVGKGTVWVKKMWGDRMEITEWSRVKGVLTSVMWIESIHDLTGTAALRWLTET